MGTPVLTDRQVVLPEEVGGRVARDVVELVDRLDVRAVALDHLGDFLRLGVARRREVGDELPGGRAVQRSVEGGEADVGPEARGSGAGNQPSG
ncbi:hypothetical protein [Amycolatopsis sp. NPDC003731]